MPDRYQLNWKTRLLDKILSSTKPIEQMSLDELKANSEKSLSPLVQLVFAGKQISVSKIVDQKISGRHGDIPLRLYYSSEQKSLPLIVFFHGGGWVYGNLDTHDRSCRRVARDTGGIVLAVGYRLAPFYKYPTAVDDCYDALSWAVQNATTLSADPRKIIVMGDSAGGNLATAVCLMARDRGHRLATQQILIYPVVSGKLDLPSTDANADAPVLTKSRMQYFVDCYARDEADISEPYFSPLLAENLSNLPPALIIAGEYDILHDQAQMYAERLQEAGIPVKLLDYPKTIHGFISFPPFCNEAQLAFREIAEYIRNIEISDSSSDQ